MATAFLLPDPARIPTSFATQLIDAAGEKAASIFQAPKTGNIDRVLFRTGTVTTAQSLSVGLQTVNASGDASGTLYGGSAAGTQASPASNTQYEVTLATPAVAVMGDDIACVIEWVSTAGNLQISVVSPVVPNVFGNPYTEIFTASWAKSAMLPCVGVRYDDAAWYDVFAAPLASLNGNNFNLNTATFDEYALRFSLDVSHRLVGYWAHLGTTAAGDFEAILYSGTTALLTSAVDADVKGESGRTLCRRFGASYDLAASTEYRLAIRPTTANNVSCRTYTQNSAAYWGSFPFGTEGYLSKRLNQGAWTDVTTERPHIGLIVEPIVPSGGSISISTVLAQVSDGVRAVAY